MFEKYSLNMRTRTVYKISREIKKFLQNQKFWRITIDPKNNI
jgi:N-glycosylase/DNA lyase